MDQGSYGRAYNYGTVWLNELFVAKAQKSRLWRTSIRLTVLDVLAMTLLAIVFGAILFALGNAILVIPGMDRLVSPFVLALLGLPPAWFLGRRASNASPYARRTGEGIGAYLFVKADTKSYLMGRLIGRRVAVNRCIATTEKGHRITMDCVEWLGTARAPLMPKFDPDRPRPQASFEGQYGEGGAAVMDVYLVPSNVPTPWVDEVRRRARLEKSWMERRPS